jgi:hypothetical protein
MTKETISIVRELDRNNKALNVVIKRQKALMRRLKQRPGCHVPDAEELDRMSTEQKEDWLKSFFNI